MVCQNCVEGETCPECEKYPHDIHTTPPPNWNWNIHGRIVYPSTTDGRIAQLEQDVHDLKNKMQALMMKMEMMGKRTP